MNDFICCGCGANPLTDYEVESLNGVCKDCCEDDHYDDKDCKNSICPFRFTCAGIEYGYRNIK